MCTQTEYFPVALSNLLLFNSVYFPVLLARADHHVDISRSDQEMFAKTPLYSNKFLLQSKTMAQSMSNESGQPTASFASSQALHTPPHFFQENCSLGQGRFAMNALFFSNTSITWRIGAGVNPAHRLEKVQEHYSGIQL